MIPDYIIGFLFNILLIFSSIGFYLFDKIELGFYLLEVSIALNLTVLAMQFSSYYKDMKKLNQNNRGQEK